MKTFKMFMEHIVKTGSGYKLLSKKTGKNLGTASSLSAIKKRERQVQYFKHQHEEVLDEMGAGAVGGSAGPTNVTGTNTSTDPISATAVNMKKKKRRPILMSMGRRTPPMK
jgi:hypothetical protein